MKPFYLFVVLSLMASTIPQAIGFADGEMERSKRLMRSPTEVAQQLSRRYGRSLKQVQYIPAVAVIGRLRLGELTGDVLHRADIDRLVTPFREGTQKAIGDKPSGSDLAGHLVFGELAMRTQDDKLIALTKAAADLAFDEKGKPLKAVPFHNEMSDAVFMGCPLLTQVGRLTSDAKYHDMAVTHLAFMQKLCLRADGIYRHSPLDEAAWGRGNGFPALGLAWSLDNLPQEHFGRPAMLSTFQIHMAALKSHQDAAGMWHQVIDHPESYPELTATCMITFSMSRGIRADWLDRATYEPLIRKAWSAISARIGEDGSLTGVCEGTGKQPNLQAYFDRKAINGFDDRGGAMSLLVAVELATFDAASAPR